ncbi:hypothetical protein C8F01DRAFT_991743 [Mycena amicta]|nr:hypothetical protein C8F01DRAFT_991770 [Mycena amicta]KAJ7057583.1 hypothetical protein C8F01DRAFT_991743 [Mycena amicta]
MFSFLTTLSVRHRLPATVPRQTDDRAVQASSAVRPTGSDIECKFEICDAIRSRSVPAKNAMLSLKRRLKHRNPNVQILALELTDMCVKNGGDLFLLQIASGEFMDDLVSILKSPDLHDKVKNHILLHIQDWCIMFEGEPKLSYVGMIYTTLTAEGFQFPPKDPLRANPDMLNTQQPPEWIDSEFCSRCATRFHLTNRKHHCRNCGSVFDQQCSAKMLPLPHIGFRPAVRVCDGCYATLTSNPG